MSKENEINILKRYLPLMFIVALFSITKIWKQTKCPLVDEWTKYIYIYVSIYLYNGYYLALVKKEILPLVITWVIWRALY